MFVFVHDLYSQSSKERRADFNYREGLAVEGLVCGGQRTQSMVGNNDLCSPAESLTCIPWVMRPAATAFKASLTLGKNWSGESAMMVIVKSSKKAGIGSLVEPSGSCL